MTIDDKMSEEQVKALIQPYDETFLQAWAVKPIRGKKSKSQTAAIIEKHEFGTQMDLF
jgi:hypothetical protein